MSGRIGRFPNHEDIALLQWRAAQTAQDVCGGAAGNERRGNPAADAELAASAGFDRATAERLAGFDGAYFVRGQTGGPSASKRDPRAIGERKCAAEQSHFQRRRVVDISENAIADTKGQRIGRACPRDALSAVPRTAKVLYGGQHAGGLNQDRHMGMNLMWSPGWRRLMGVLAALKSSNGVWPINCQPPGVVSG